MFDLRFEFLPGSMSPVSSHARTWGRLEIILGGTPATHVEDRESTSVRDGVFLPLFPLAHWFLSNWWFVLDEPPPPAAVDGGARAVSHHRPWFERHNLLFAREGFPLPNLTISRSDDQLLDVTLEPDPVRTSVFPVRFLDRWRGIVPRDDFEKEVRRFIKAIVDRVGDLQADDANELVQAWAAITSLTSDDRLLRRRAAALGLDGDDPEIVDDPLAENLVDRLKDLPGGLVMDMLEAVVSPSHEVPARAADVRRARALRSAQNGGPLSETRAIIGPIEEDDAKHRVGWRMAATFRKHFAIDPGTVAGALDAAVARTRIVAPVAQDDAFADEFIRGWVAADAEHTASVVLARTARPQSRRFLQARAIALALLGGRERLITASPTRTQSISRAFATELLAPIDAIRANVQGPVVSAQRVDEIAGSLQVDRQVVVHQIENHHLASVAD